MKQRTPAKIFIPLTIFFIIIAFMVVTPTDYIPEKGLLGMLDGFFHQLRNVLSQWIVWLVLAIALIMLLIINGINKIVERNKFQKLTEVEQQKYLEQSKTPYLKRLLRSSREKQSAEEEESIILDHGFDGIKELDNSLPQWWLAMFYLGCAFMVVYVTAYFTTDFAHPLAEYEVEDAQLQKAADIWIAENDIKEIYDERNVNRYLDPAALEEGKKHFDAICAACHTPNGGGSTGPNLTDDYWVNQVEDSLYYNIYNIVFNGSPKNPVMVSFVQTEQLTGLDIQNVASYVYHLNQKEKDVTVAEGGLAPQGDFVAKWAQDGKQSPPKPKEANEAEAPKDSTVTQVTNDSVQ